MPNYRSNLVIRDAGLVIYIGMEHTHLYRSSPMNMSNQIDKKWPDENEERQSYFYII